MDAATRNQLVVAYVGSRQVYATAVSTGRPQTPTPLGVHRIWVKLAEDDMDDLERDDVSENYAIQAVPWVQYFEGSNGFHTAFWHDRFGRPRSHGCINLAPRDAKWLYNWAGPDLPESWHGGSATEDNPGTWVYVHGETPGPRPRPASLISPAPP